MSTWLAPCQRDVAEKDKVQQEGVVARTVFQDVLMKCFVLVQDVLMKGWPQRKMVRAPEQTRSLARALPPSLFNFFSRGHLFKFFFKGVDGLLRQDGHPKSKMGIQTCKIPQPP